MATAQSIPATAAASAGSEGPGEAAPRRGGSGAAAPAAPGANAADQALALVPQIAAAEPEPLLEPLTRLPVELDVAVPVEEFRVRDLLALEPGRVIPSRWNYGEDVPLAAGEVQLAWSEFEVIDGQLGVRITRLP